MTLVNQESAQVPLASLLESEAPVALNFVFTTCNTICPVMTATLSRMREELGPAANELRIVSISVDPEHDTPKVLKNYASKHGADWQFLTGDSDQILTVQKAFGAFAGSKMNHQPLIFFRIPGRGQWIRINGFASASELASEYRRLLENPGGS